MKTFKNESGNTVNEFDNTLSVVDLGNKKGHFRFLVCDTTQDGYIGFSHESETHAIFDALKQYQKRIKEIEEERSVLLKKIDSFIESVGPEINQQGLFKIS